MQGTGQGGTDGRASPQKVWHLNQKVSMSGIFPDGKGEGHCNLSKPHEQRYGVLRAGQGHGCEVIEQAADSAPECRLLGP